ncbi:MAG: helix-turn-helix domain-containing protein, partial [Bacteroidota bacterium]
TGKTTFLRYIVSHTYKQAVVAAPTGVAAIHAGGVTLHSLLHLPFGAFIPENIAFHSQTSVKLNTPQSLVSSHRFNEKKLRMLRQMELLIIDEVSMLRADLLDCIDLRLRTIRKQNTPFGGVQLLLIGDLMQLPPVVKEEEWVYLKSYYKSPYFFEAQAFRTEGPLTVELQKIYRQRDDRFIEVLNRLRYNQQTQEDIQFLNTHHEPDAQQEGYIHLTTHNYKADQINQRELAQLETQSHTFEAEILGTFPEHQYPNLFHLRLKVGAQVMFIKNDTSGEGRFFNGKIGKVTKIQGDNIWVTFEDGDKVWVAPHEWEHVKFGLNEDTQQIEEQRLGSFLQYPLKLAWAVTVHKSQGLTFEKAILDVSDSFAPGQLYVALSRLTGLEGLKLSSPIPARPPQPDAALLNFMDYFEDEASLKQRLKEDKKGFIADFAKVAFDLGGIYDVLALHLASFHAKGNKSVKVPFRAWTAERVEQVQPLLSVGKKFTHQVQRLLMGEGDWTTLDTRCKKAHAYFEDIMLGEIRIIQQHIHTLLTKEKVKGYLEELEEIEGEYIFHLRRLVRFCMLVQWMAAGKSPEKDMMQAWEQAHGLKIEKRKPKKRPTADVTFELYEKGMGVEEIAEAREIKISTVQAHLAKCVEKGLIPVEKLIEKAKLAELQKLLADQEYELLSEIKSALNDRFSYEDIKLVL